MIGTLDFTSPAKTIESTKQFLERQEFQPLPKIAHINNIGFNATILYCSPLPYDMSIHRVSDNRDIIHAGLPVQHYKTGLSLVDHIDRLDPDIIHVHSTPNVLGLLKSLRKRNGKEYPVVYTSSGSDVRIKGWKVALEAGVEYADIVTAVTPDLLTLKNTPETAVLTLNAADPQHFSRRNDPVEGFGMMRGFIHGQLDNDYSINKYNEVTRDMPNTRTWFNRCLYPYAVYPNFLEMFEILYDFKKPSGTEYDEELPLSRTALEFLTLGKTRVYHQDRVLTKLPREYSYDKFIATWKEIYRIATEIY